MGAAIWCSITLKYVNIAKSPAGPEDFIHTEIKKYMHDEVHGQDGAMGISDMYVWSNVLFCPTGLDLSEPCKS